MDRVVLLRLRQRCLVALPAELEASVGQPVGPRNENRAMASICDAIDGKGLNHVTIAEAVYAQSSADFHDDRGLIFVTQFELLARGRDLWPRTHWAMIPEPARVLNARSKLPCLPWRNAACRGSQRSGARTGCVRRQRQRERDHLACLDVRQLPL